MLNLSDNFKIEQNRKHLSNFRMQDKGAVKIDIKNHNF